MGNLDDQLARVPLGALRENQGGIFTGENMGKWFSEGSQELKALELKFGVKLFQRCFRAVLEFLEGESQVSVSFWWCYSTSSDLGWGPWSLPQQRHGALSKYSYELLAVSRKMHGKTEILLILSKTSEVQSNLLSFPHLQRIWRGVKFSFSPLWQNRLQKNMFFSAYKKYPSDSSGLVPDLEAKTKHQNCCVLLAGELDCTNACICTLKVAFGNSTLISMWAKETISP